MAHKTIKCKFVLKTTPRHQISKRKGNTSAPFSVLDAKPRQCRHVNRFGWNYRWGLSIGARQVGISRTGPLATNRTEARYSKERTGRNPLRNTPGL